MARLARIQVPGVPVHVVIRGNDRRAIFYSEGDRIYFHRTLVEASRRYGLDVHAYVLMTNHAHLLATPRQVGALCRTIQALGRNYVRYFNHRYGRTGTLFEGRFRSSPVATDHHLVACYRYIEMNPVRAGMVGAPGQFEWSSHRANLGMAIDDLVTPHELFLSIAAAVQERRRQYAELCAEALPQSMVDRIRDCLNNGWALGDDAGRREIEARAGRRAHRVGDARARALPSRSANAQHSDPTHAQHSDPTGQEGQGTARIWAPA
jgi:putative transposase